MFRYFYLQRELNGHEKYFTERLRSPDAFFNGKSPSTLVSHFSFDILNFVFFCSKTLIKYFRIPLKNTIIKFK